MGFTPAQVDEMSFFQFQAAAEGFRRANTPADKRGLSRAQFDDLAAWVPLDGSAPN